MAALRVLIRPFGYLAFVISLGALSTAAWLLGENNDLGFFCGRLAQTMWRYREVTRRGIRVAWVTWGALVVIALSPLDPLATRWDEIVLVALALAVLWRRFFAARQVGH